MARAIAVLVLAFFARPTAQKPVESAHVPGPNGLEGWTESVTIDEVKEQGPLPVALVIARHGKVVRRIDGSPFVWTWKFQPDGKRVAYEVGPLHSSLWCELVDIATGKEISSYDCFTGIPDDAPEWLKDLEWHGQ